MRVRDLMTEEVQTAAPESNLAAVASLMWFGDCGAVPVVGSDGTVVGLITDRDICIALASRSRPAADVRVREILAGRVHTCGPDDDVAEALLVMREAQVRRLPVVDAGGRLVGILSLTDALMRAGGPDPGGPSVADVLTTLRALSHPHARSLARRGPEAPVRSEIF